MLATISSAPLNVTSTPDAFTCKTCLQTFRRADHLRRHELSHGTPKYLCSHHGCGMRFHREDVRNRHEVVHQPNPFKQRRRARRGALPRNRIPSTNEGYLHRDLTGATQTSPPVSSGESPQSQPLPISWNWDIADFGGLMPSEVDSIQPSFITHHPVLYDLDPLAADVSMASFMPSTGSKDEILRICVEHVKKSHLVRKPFIHSQTITSPSLAPGLRLAMAALGSVVLPEYAMLARSLFDEACQQLQTLTLTNDLRRLQCQVLLIDFAIWTTDEVLRQWALKEGQAASLTIQALMKTQWSSIDEQDWVTWIYHEELKRTIFAFYSTFVCTSLVYDYTLPLSFQHITLDLPACDSLWIASTESAWTQQLLANSSAPQPNVSFPLALYTLLSCDTVRGDIHETATIFGQHILLCGISEAFTTARKLPMNYSSAEGFRTSDMLAFQSRNTFLESLRIWKSLWWVSIDCCWDKNSFALPQAENVFLLNHLFVAISRGCLKEGVSTRDSVAAAIEMFCCASKNGFHEINEYGSRVLSMCARKHAMACATFMLDWLRVFMAPEEPTMSLCESHADLLCAVRQSVRRGMRESSNSAGDIGLIETLYACVQNLWNVLFGTPDWLSRELF